MDESSDLMPQVFMVEDEIEEGDLNAPPTSGQEYLRRVQLEAAKCPDVVVKDYPDRNKNMSTAWRVYTTKSLLPAPSGFAPSLTWQRNQVADFAEVRQKLAKYKAKIKKQKQKPPKSLPSKEDINGWCQLCFGRLKVASRSGGANDDPCGAEDKEDDDKGDALVERLEADQATSGSPPLLSIVAFMDQPTVLSVLEYHINWFEATGFSTEQGRWFYALLAALEKPLEPESCYSLRLLARNCANLRATLESVQASFLPQLNLLICLVSRYFDQLDLADQMTTL